MVVPSLRILMFFDAAHLRKEPHRYPEQLATASAWRLAANTELVNISGPEIAEPCSH